MGIRSKLFGTAMCLISFAGAADAATCIGNCGTSADVTGPSVVVAAPIGNGSYDWISSYLGQEGAGQIAGFEGEATNGSELLSDTFYAAANSEVSFFFNYVTSDGSGYADYGFAQLINVATGAVTANIFTARTKPSGPIVPGLDLPAVEATLNPVSVPIIPGGPIWSPLGPNSGYCYDSGCGYTGWVQSSYTVQDAGSYQLRFGVTNWSDNSVDTGMAFSGLLLNDATIGDGSTADSPLLPSEITPDGGFAFTFTPTPQQPVFIDPTYAIGYTYAIETGDNAILSVLLPTLPFDSDGYDIYSLAGTLLASGVYDYDFAGSGVAGFKLLDIDLAAMLDPTDPGAFVTGLTFANSNIITMSQTPITQFVASVPEPTSWIMMILGFGLVGAAARRRSRPIVPA